MTEPVTYARIPAAEIERLIKKITSTIMGEDEQAVMMACLAVALSTFFHDSLTGPILLNGVQGASEWMLLYSQSVGLDKPKEQMN